jgi:hydroxyacid-oxoacid transhydrogenase
MATSSVRYGRGVTLELGHDAVALGARRVGVVTDAGMLRTRAFERTLAALDGVGLHREVYSEVSVEPTDASFQHAAAWAKVS